MEIPFDDTGITILVGGLGCGKTELSANLAFCMAKKYNDLIHIIDLDNIKPYFKIRNLDEKYRISNVNIVAPDIRYSFADLPIISPEARTIAEISEHVIVDVGGDASGARVLGGYSEVISKRKYNMFFVVNSSRPFMRDFDSALLAIRDIENMSSLKVTGIVNNTHMMWNTTTDIFEDGRKISKRLSFELGVPFVFSCVSVDSILEKKDFYDENLFKMELFFLNKI